ncbi:sensor histidine kinase [Chitinimonas sp. PSY-7]|uniref:sensor histidine kinase N-terminal domain-containing protein n=1 Tax=Chitinimonas sp. PSY-7 TaxID=3459088 RepID=UPI0040403CA8
MLTRHSLRRTLTTRLVAALSVVALMGSVVGYALADRYANLAYDRALLDLAISLSKQVTLHNGVVRLDLPPSAQRVLLADQYDVIVYRVTDLTQNRVLGQHGLPTPLKAEMPVDGRALFQDIKSSLGPLRLTRMVIDLENGKTALVEVGETRYKRDSLIRDVLIALIGLMMVLAAVTIAVLWDGISRALAPLVKLEVEAASRSLDNLSPLDLGTAPREVRGLINSINHMMARLETAVNVQQRFTANAAHQLRTPLAALQLHVQLSLKDPRNAASQDVLKEIEQSASRAIHTAEQLLTLSRAESAQVHMGASEIDLAVLARSVTERFVPAALARQIDLGYEGANQLSGLIGNPQLLEEMLGNLIDNACRYISPGCWITVSVQRCGDNALISVADNGPGIPPSQREQVFQRFFRGDNVPAEGAGLGLSIVREITEQHGGRVEIGENEQGCGCKALVTLPMAPEKIL